MKTLTTDQLATMREQKPSLTLINVLDPEPFRKAHIPGSLNIQVSDEQFTSKVEQRTGGKDKPVVVYCASVDCDASPKAARKLTEAGFTQVYDYEGGTKAWKEAGKRVEASAEAAAS